jgi:hypothetical protein
MRYAPKDMLQAKDVVPRKLREKRPRIYTLIAIMPAVDISIGKGEPGLQADHPIKLEDDTVKDNVEPPVTRKELSDKNLRAIEAIEVSNPVEQWSGFADDA